MIYDKLVKAAEDHKQLFNELMVNHAEALQGLTQDVVKAFHGEGRLLLLGSGTLGAVTTLAANLFLHRLAIDRPSLPAISLCQNAPLATALGADGLGDQYLLRQMRTIARPGDIVLAFDDVRHGASVREALAGASAIGCGTARVLLGSDPSNDDVDYLFCFPQLAPARGIEASVLFCCLLCELVEADLFGF
jgi:D-sedoheptulose 7-phosphate isomerase